MPKVLQETLSTQREIAARATYSRQQRPQSAGCPKQPAALPRPAADRKIDLGAARRREQASASGRTKLVRPGTAPARRPDNAAAIKKMVTDAAHHNQANDEQTRIRSM